MVKLNTDFRPMLKKRRMHMSIMVSLHNPLFSCEGSTDILLTRGKGKRPTIRLRVGVSKEEDRVSDYFNVDGSRVAIGTT